MSIKVQDGFKKRIGKYLISYCQTQYYGKSLHGQMRAGYEQPNKKIVIYRMNPLPLSNNMKTFLALQQTYSDLKEYARVVYDDVSSSSTNYTVLELFPKTFESEILNFRKTPKYFDEYIEKFLKTYAFFYNMNVAHGNLLPSNIGITFDSKVKLMDFQILPQDSCEKAFKKDFQSFKLFVSRVLQKDSNYPYKFESFNKEENERWEHLFSCWHVTSPLEPLYIERESYVENIVTGLYKLESSLQEIYQRFEDERSEEELDRQEEYQQLQNNEESSQIDKDLNKVQTKQGVFIQSSIHKLHDLKMAIRLLQLNYLTYQGKSQKLTRQKQNLQEIIGPLQQHDLDYYNSILIGSIRDYEFYNIDPSRRLFLLTCLIPNLNHEYIFDEIVKELKDQNEYRQRNLLLGDSLYGKYKDTVFRNLLKIPTEKGILL